MPIFQVSKGNMFDLNADILVNAVNTIGVMGAGLALKYAKTYPGMYEDYKSKCVFGIVEVGKIHVYHTDNCIIFNFPTKKDWRDPSRIEYIDSGLIEMKRILLGTYSFPFNIAIPALGCGLGGLNFSDVKDLVYKHLGKDKNRIFLFEPQ